MLYGNKDAKGQGFDGNPQNINRKGVKKGTKWRKTLLKEIMDASVDILNDEQKKELIKKFPRIFDGNQNANLQLLLELKQISLVFSKNEKVSQIAIQEIKDRIDGKAKQSVEHVNSLEIKGISFDK